MVGSKEVSLVCDDNKLCFRGIIEIWDLEKATFMMQFKGGNCDILYSLFTRGMVLAATDDKDGMLRVWLTDNLTKPFFEEKVVWMYRPTVSISLWPATNQDEARLLFVFGK